MRLLLCIRGGLDHTTPISARPNILKCTTMIIRRYDWAPYARLNTVQRRRLAFSNHMNPFTAITMTSRQQYAEDM